MDNPMENYSNNRQVAPDSSDTHSRHYSGIKRSHSPDSHRSEYMPRDNPQSREHREYFHDDKKSRYIYGEDY